MLVGCMNIARIFLCGLVSFLLAITWILLTYLTVPVIIAHQKVASVDGVWSANKSGLKRSCDVKRNQHVDQLHKQCFKEYLEKI